ncbi:hypothetical protein HY212_02195 [Candidatus Pacearchaeota archaeon]|nr:hypothetical protein [Candidatus Pacearchaeota archaeon]
MKTLHLSIVIVLVMIGLGSNTAFAEMSKSVITVNDTQYEIDYNTVHSTINTILPNLHSYFRNSLDMNITSDKQYNGTMTLTLTKDAIANVFCITRDDVDNYLQNYQDFYVLVDNNYEKFTTSSTGDKVSLSFDIQAGSKNATIVNQFVGMAVSTAIDFKGIPEVGIYKPDQKIAFNGILADTCGRHLGEEKIYFTAEQLNVTKQVTSDSKGKFSINFTIPENTESGHYKSKIEMYSKNNLSGINTIYLIIEKNGESNIPFLFKTDFGSFEIPYHLDHGEIIDVNQYFVENSISVQYYATQNGIMEILFPKTLIDLVSGNIGTTTVITGNQDIANFPERTDSENHRIFDIPVYTGRNFIDISISREGDHPAYSNSGLQALVVGDKLYPVSYNITGGSIRNLGADIFHKRIRVETFGAQGGGHLHLELPRNIFDSIQDGQDKKFVVTNTLIVNGLPSSTKSVDYTESNTTEKSRMLEIHFPQYQSFTEIQGTTIIPEFPFVIPILLFGIISTIVFYRMKFRK